MHTDTPAYADLKSRGLDDVDLKSPETRAPLPRTLPLAAFNPGFADVS